MAWGAVVQVFRILVFFWVFMCTEAAFAAGIGSPEERFWISREVISSGVDNCRNGDCPRFSDFTTRLFNPNDRDNLRRMMSLLDFQSAAAGRPLIHPETPQFCSRQLPNPEQVIWNPEWMQMSDKLESLRGLQGLHVDVSGLKGPEGFVGDFGPSLQAELERQFSAAGIRMVTKEEVEKVPGQPKLAVYFSATNPDSGCWWSVFATMTQTAILTRDINVKINAGSWAFMKGYDPDNLQMTEYDAIVEVFAAFVDDFQAANADDFVPVNVPPYVAIDGTPMTAPAVHVKSYDDILADAATNVPEDMSGGSTDTAAIETAPASPEAGFTPAATKPELTAKALRRLNLETSDSDDADGALEKLTTTGSDNAG